MESAPPGSREQQPGDSPVPLRHRPSPTPGADAGLRRRPLSLALIAALLTQGTLDRPRPLPHLTQL